jgi:hypothetical protein
VEKASLRSKRVHYPARKSGKSQFAVKRGPLFCPQKWKKPVYGQKGSTILPIKAEKASLAVKKGPPFCTQMQKKPVYGQKGVHYSAR